MKEVVIPACTYIITHGQNKSYPDFYNMYNRYTQIIVIPDFYIFFNSHILQHVIHNNGCCSEWGDTPVRQCLCAKGMAILWRGIYF